MPSHFTILIVRIYGADNNSCHSTDFQKFLEMESSKAKI